MNGRNDKAGSTGNRALGMAEAAWKLARCMEPAPGKRRGGGAQQLNHLRPWLLRALPLLHGVLELHGARPLQCPSF